MEIETPPGNKEISLWVSEYGDALYSWAIHATANEEVAQDLVQETFLSALQNISGFKGGSSPKTWLFSILKNKMMDYFRQTARRKIESLDQAPDSFDQYDQWKKEFRPHEWSKDEEHLLDNAEFKKILTHCMNNLPEGWSACINLKYLSEKDPEEICQHLHITTSNLWQILHRAKLSLRNCLEKNWFKS